MPRDGSSGGSRGRSAIVLSALLVALGFLQYSNTLGHDYAWDDKLVITNNEYTLKGVAGLPEIVSQRVSVPFKSVYRPVPQAMYAIEYELFGLDPFVGHLMNVLWYALACLIVHRFLRFSLPGCREPFPTLAALLFLVHPLHVEVVANIKGRDEILVLVFGLSSVMLLVRAIEERRWGLALAGVLAFSLAALSKANAITLLPVVALVAWYRSVTVKVSRRLVVGLGALAAISLGLVLLLRLSHTNAGDEQTLNLSSTVLNNIFLWTTQPENVLPTALVIIGRYALLFVWPHPLLHLYGYDQIPMNRWSEPVTWLVIVALAGLAWLVARRWRDKPPALFGLVFWALTYSAYSNIFFLAPDTMADRYLFLPSVGVVVLAVAALYRLAGWAPDRSGPPSRRARIVVAGFLVVLVAFSVRTWLGNRDWENDDTLIENRIELMSRNAAAQAIRGHMLQLAAYEEASPEARLARASEAMQAFTRAITIYPDFYWAWIAIGKLFAEQQIYDKAELAFFKAQRIEPMGPDAYFVLGTLYLSWQNPALATTYLEKTVLLDPNREEAYVMLGRAYLQGGQVDNLGAMAETALEWFPGNVRLVELHATYHFRTGDYARAIEMARAVLAVDPESVLATAIVSAPAAQELGPPS